LQLLSELCYIVEAIEVSETYWADGDPKKLGLLDVASTVPGDVLLNVATENKPGVVMCRTDTPPDMPLRKDGPIYSRRSITLGVHHCQSGANTVPSAEGIVHCRQGLSCVQGSAMGELLNQERMAAR
jgi:hypothetical protein